MQSSVTPGSFPVPLILLHSIASIWTLELCARSSHYFWLPFWRLRASSAWQVYTPVTPPPGQTFVLLHSGYTTRRIAAELKKAGIIRSEFAFRLWHAAHPKPSLKAGEYLFEREATLPQVYDRIARGDIYFHVVTIPEGYTMFDIAKAMEDAGLGSAADFLHIAETSHSAHLRSRARRQVA